MSKKEAEREREREMRLEKRKKKKKKKIEYYIDTQILGIISPTDH